MRGHRRVVILSVIASTIWNHASRTSSTNGCSSRGNKRVLYKPKYIILLRHGESEGNADPIKYATSGDPNIQLTAKGREQ